MVHSSRCQWIIVAVLVALTASSLSCLAWGQGFSRSPYSAPDILGRKTTGLDLSPSNPLSMPTPVANPGMDSILVTPQLFQGILPLIPNLEAGYLYNFGKGVDSGRLTLDYLLPVELDKDTAVFGEFHNEWQDFWKTVTRGANHRIDLSLGGGYRTIVGGNIMVGVNAFYDTTRLGRRWYPSGGVGLEMAALIPGGDEVDLTFNWYGNMFRSDVLANVFRRGPSNYDFQVGYSHELWEDGPDLRLHGAGYRFSAGSGVYGSKGGAELKTRDGMFSIKYEAAHDSINKTYHTVGGFVNVGLQLSNLLNGESPFVMPEPIFKSPRNLRRLLTENTRRRWGGPASIVLSAATTQGSVPGGPGPFCVVGPTTMQLVGPITLTNGAAFNIGLVPDITGLGLTNVVVRWNGIGLNPGLDDVFFRMYDGARWYYGPFFPGPGIDMSASNGVATFSLTLEDFTTLNGAEYVTPISGNPLVIQPGGVVCFEFF